MPAGPQQPILPHLVPPGQPKSTAAATTENGKPKAKDAAALHHTEGGRHINNYTDSLLSFLVEEVKDLKQANADLKEELRRSVKKLKDEITQLHASNQHKEIDKTDFIPFIPSASSHLPSSSYSTPLPFSIATSRAEIIATFPFLSSYRLEATDTPFAVHDLNKPFVAMRTMETTVGEEENPPMIVAANPAFCELTKYSLHELIGCPLPKILFPDEKVRKQYLPLVNNRKPDCLVSECISFSPICVPKTGGRMRLAGRLQVFYNEAGIMRWGVLAAETIEEDVASIEMPLHWQPGLPKWWHTFAEAPQTNPETQEEKSVSPASQHDDKISRASQLPPPPPPQVDRD